MNHLKRSLPSMTLLGPASAPAALDQPKPGVISHYHLHPLGRRLPRHMHLLQVLRNQVAALGGWEGLHSLKCKASHQARLPAIHCKICRNQHQRSTNRLNIVSAFTVTSHKLLVNETASNICNSRRSLTHFRNIGTRVQHSLHSFTRSHKAEISAAVEW